MNTPPLHTSACPKPLCSWGTGVASGKAPARGFVLMWSRHTARLRSTVPSQPPLRERSASGGSTRSALGSRVLVSGFGCSVPQFLAWAEERQKRQSGCAATALASAACASPRRWCRAHLAPEVRPSPPAQQVPVCFPPASAPAQELRACEHAAGHGPCLCQTGESRTTEREEVETKQKVQSPARKVTPQELLWICFLQPGREYLEAVNSCGTLGGARHSCNNGSWYSPTASPKTQG